MRIQPPTYRSWVATLPKPARVIVGAVEIALLAIVCKIVRDLGIA